VLVAGGAVASGRRVRGAGPVAFAAACAVLALAGCSTPAGAGPTPSPSAAAPTTTSASPTPAPEVRLAGDAPKASYLSPVRLEVANGTFTSVQVNTAPEGQELDGSLAVDGSVWESEAPPRPGTSYKVVASVKDGASDLSDRTLTFAVQAVPNDQRLTFSVTPNGGATVGIGQPVVVRFLTAVTKRAAVEKAMLVDARTPAGTAVTGSWHWLSGSEVHWRPKEFWTPGTTVDLDMRIAGVQASPNRYGRKDYRQTFTIGASHVTQVDATTHRVKAYRDGKLVADWPSGTGKRGLETYSGTYVVLGKASVVRMDSCSARITCDKEDPEYYDDDEKWATRITASGTFLHAADWDHQLGRANISHGCIHLSERAAKTFFDGAVLGDVVIVKNTGRGAQERIATQDPGLYDWNVSWEKWTAGSAL
jgi:lipoprotein-anchoring transpeptidase ErfK/SrfK